MIYTMPNQRTVTVKMTRRQLCDCMTAVTHLKHDFNDECERWNTLYDLLKRQLDAHDQKFEEKE